MQQLAAEYSLIRGIVGYAPVHLGQEAEGHLQALGVESLVVGVRRLLQGRPREEIIDPGLIAGVRLLPAWRLTFDVCVTHDQLPEVLTLVRLCPETTFVLDHLGKPPVASGQLDPWRANLARIASLPNIEHALESFGPRRCMFASDWPVSTLRTTYDRWVDVVLDLIAELAPGDQAAVLAGTAARTYGLSGAVLAGEGGLGGRG